MSADLRQRNLIVKQWSLGSVTRIFRYADAIEVDLLDVYDVHVKRTFFTDIETITLNRKRTPAARLWGLVASELTLAFLLAYSWGGHNGIDLQMLLTIIAIVLSPVIALLIYLLITYAHVPAFGRRGSVVMSWHLRHARARRVFSELVKVVRTQQQTVGHQIVPASSSSL